MANKKELPDPFNDPILQARMQGFAQVQKFLNQQVSPAGKVAQGKTISIEEIRRMVRGD